MKILTRKTILLGIVVLSLLALILYLPKRSSKIEISEAKANVIITDKGFEPEYLNVKTGTTVTWTNNDNKARKLKALDNSHDHKDRLRIDSEEIGPGESYSLTFDKTDTYKYTDSSDEAQTGSVKVN